MSDEYKELLDFAIAQARMAGAIMLDYFQKVDKVVQRKADASPVTIADKLINTNVVSAVKRDYPKHGVFGEEEQYKMDCKDLWVCDPIDGTKGFIIGLPTAMFSLAFVRDGQPVVAVAYDPFVDRLYTATLGGGAYINGAPLHVSSQLMIDSTITVTGSVERFFTYSALFDYLMQKGAYVDKFPGAVIKSSLVAQGLIDGHIFPGTGAYDIAATKLIVEEAGGKVTDLNGNPQPYDKPIYGAIVSNGVVHEELVKAVAQVGSSEFLGR